jgi:hypothetical protein
VLRGVRRRRRTRIALIDVGQLHGVAGQRLDLLGQRADLRPILGVGRGHPEGEQMAQRIDHQMRLRALLPFGAVVPGPGATLRCALQRAAIDRDGRRRRGAALRHAQERPQIMHERLEAAGGDPALGLLIHDFPRGKVVRQVPPRRPRAHQPAQRVVHGAQRILALRRVFSAQGQVRRDEGPLLVGDRARVRLAFGRRPTAHTGLRRDCSRKTNARQSS